MRRVLAAVCAVALTGCGSPAADLFVVHRSGADRNANLTLLVSDDGTVTCNGAKHPISNALLLDARKLTRSLSEQAVLNLELPPGPRSVLAYRVRMQAGTIAFADSSHPLPRSFGELTVFTKHVSEDICRLDRR